MARSSRSSLLNSRRFFLSWLCGKRFLKVCRSLFRTTDFRIFRVLCGFASAGHIGWWPKPKHSLQRSSLGLPGKARIHAVQLICCGYTSILYTSTLLLFLPWRLGRNCNIALYKFEFAGAHWSRVSVVGVFVASLWGGTGGHFGLLAGWLPMAPSVCSGWKLVFCLGGPASPLCFASVRFGLWFQSLGT